jgi:hypothetical protein
MIMITITPITALVPAFPMRFVRADSSRLTS